MTVNYKVLKGYSEYHVYPDGEIFSGYEDGLMAGHVSNGFRLISLMADEGGSKLFYRHKLVAELFIPNPNPTRYKWLQFRDGDKMNCHFQNLRWSAQPPNQHTHPYRKKIKAIRIEDGNVTKYQSINSATKDGFLVSKIIDCLKGRRKTHKGHTFESDN